MMVCGSLCTGFGWELDGSTFCAISDKSSIVFLWDVNTKKFISVDSGFRWSLWCAVCWFDYCIL